MLLAVEPESWVAWEGGYRPRMGTSVVCPVADSAGTAMVTDVMRLEMAESRLVPVRGGDDERLH
jgi:hypothetical protein